jgi:hypothetical protein
LASGPPGWLLGAVLTVAVVAVVVVVAHRVGPSGGAGTLPQTSHAVGPATSPPTQTHGERQQPPSARLGPPIAPPDEDPRVDLWRVVGQDELADIGATGRIRPSPAGLESKYFWASLEDATRYAGLVDGKWDYFPPTIVHTTAPPGILHGPYEMDGMPGFTILNQDLWRLSPPSILR